MDYTLLCAGSSFTVGVAEEEHDTALTHVMVGRTRARSQNGGHNNTPSCHCCQSGAKSSHS